MPIDTLRDLQPGQLFTTTGADVWRLDSIMHQPSVGLTNIETGEKETGAIGCINLHRFRRLLPEVAITSPSETPSP